MALTINCPGCQYKFEPGEAFMKDFETQARQKMTAEWQKMKSEIDKDKAAIQQQKRVACQATESAGAGSAAKTFARKTKAAAGTAGIHTEISSRRL